MEARSTKHSPRVDEALAAEVPGISNVILETAESPLPGALGEDERRRRSELAMAMRPSSFPAQREQLIVIAREEVAPTWVLELLEGLPAETRFDTVQDVWDAAGGQHEERDVDVAEREPESASEPESGLGSAPSAFGVPTGTEAEPVVTKPPTRALAGPIHVVAGVAGAGIGLGIAAARAALSLGHRVVGGMRRA